MLAVQYTADISGCALNHLAIRLLGLALIANDTAGIATMVEAPYIFRPVAIPMVSMAN